MKYQTVANPPRVYVACLAAYNNGILHGAWIDCDRSEYEIFSDIEEIINSSPVEGAEEWAIHAFDNWKGLRIKENEDIEELTNLAQLVIKYGAAYSIYCNHCGERIDVNQFIERYQGEFDSEIKFLEDKWEETGILDQLTGIGFQYNYIDWEAIARDEFVNNYLNLDYEGIVYIFNR